MCITPCLGQNVMSGKARLKARVGTSALDSEGRSALNEALTPLCRISFMTLGFLPHAPMTRASVSGMATAVESHATEFTHAALPVQRSPVASRSR
jgi:hypothetical protein